MRANECGTTPVTQHAVIIGVITQRGNSLKGEPVGVGYCDPVSQSALPGSEYKKIPATAKKKINCVIFERNTLNRSCA